MNTSQVSHSENLQPFYLFVCFGFQININIYIYIGTNIGMHHCNSLVQSMAFTSLNTIDKNCVAVTSQGRKTSGSWGLWFLRRNPEPQRDDRRLSPRPECNAEMMSPGLFLPVTVASWYLYSSFLYFWLWMLGFPPAFRGKLCSVLSGILFWGTLVLSFNQENRFVVFFSWPYSLLSKYRRLNNCFKS